ncbi:chaperone modulator CbpM [Thiohalorhabdus sp. Cl-TMA]|uniref:Chaperone modulator CbpM n=1 Tax=Thiohalorhabdus methylotrophus TaxID=3242694 RepID=A0ABV4TUY3_9GAMM
MAEAPEPITGVILDETTVYTLGELGQASGLDAERLVQLVHLGVLEPLEWHRERWCFSGHSVLRLQTALRLQRDLGVNPEGAALALDLLDELTALRQRTDRMERQLFG